MSWPEDPTTFSTVSEDELFVFGYSCKIFRDDEKAKWIDEDKHLIPWMGDAQLLIDRYDGRGALMDLQNYEAPPHGANYLEGLTPEELRIEKLCEEERFRDFNEDEEFNESSYQEAEFKRLQMAVNEMSAQSHDSIEHRSVNKEYGSVGYVYNDSPVSMGPEPKKFQDELPYQQPPDLHIPPEILHPLTMKSHAIMEKTAKFIASQGTQMEIILKTKQAKNPQFDFLSHNDPLNPYYKFLVYAIKSNLYKPPDEIAFPGDSSSNGSDSENNENSSDGDEDGYLHPSLVKKSSDINKFIPRVNLKPSTNCAYSMLVSKIKEVSNESKVAAQNHNPPEEQSQDDHLSESNSNPTTIDIATPNYRYNLMPQPQEQMIIEKMANYVVKNGPDFEMMAKTKGDPRFAFLDLTHEHNWYYTSCKERYMLEANAVVASKGFVSYKETSPSLTTMTDLSSTSSIITNVNLSSTSTIANCTTTAPVVTTTNTVTDSLHMEDIQKQKTNYTSTIFNKSRTKESLQKGRNEKEKVIKFSTSLPNFAAVLRQQSIDEDSENSCDNNKEKVANSSSCQLAKSNTTIDSVFDLDGDRTIKVEDEETKRLKTERRRKALLFLQRLKKTHPITTTNTSEQCDGDGTDSLPVLSVTTTTTETVSDVESVPSPKQSPTAQQTTKPLTLGENVNDISNSNARKSVVQTVVEGKNQSDPLQEKLNSSRQRESNEKFQDSVGRDEDRSSRRSRHSRGRHRRSQSSRSSLSESNGRSSSCSSSSSSYSKRKKSKRKHSKKSHKKREGRSRSKKSKKRRK